MSDDLVRVLCELQYLTSLLKNTEVNFLTVNRFSTSIHCHLLTFQSTPHQSSQNTVLEELCCIGALVYLKTVYDSHLCLQVWGHTAGAVMDKMMVKKLKSCLGKIEMDTVQTRKLFLWVLFLSGAAVAGSKERAWFVARLAKAIVEWQICGWEDAKSSLVDFLWLDRIHDDSCKDLWDESMATVDVLFGGDF